MESGEGGSSTLRRRLDAKAADYFEHVVHHRVFIQNGDTFIGKQLILLFKNKTCTTLPPLEVETSSPPETSPSPNLHSEATSFEDQESEQENEDESVWPPDGVFEGFVKPDNLKSEEDDEFWDYQMLGEFQMDQISPEDYEHVLSLSSNKARKTFLYSLFRKLKREQAAKTKAEVNQEVKSLEGNRHDEEEEEEEEEEIEYEIYTSLKHPEQMERNDPRLAYLDNTTIIQLCNTEKILTCGTLILDAFTSNLSSDIAQLNNLIESIVPNFWFDPAVIPATLNIILVSNLLPWALTKQVIDEDGLARTLNEKRMKKRKPHPDYENVAELETLCLNANRDLKKNKKFQLHVLGCGIPYGLEQDIFYHWFAMGYNNIDLTSLPVINEGHNTVPTVHIEDVVKIINHLVDSPSTVKKSYILAIALENEASSLADIVKAISKVFTKDGLVRHEPLKQFAVVYPLNLVYSEDQKKTALDLLATHLPLESNFVEEHGEKLHLNLSNIVGNIERTVKDFIKDHNLKPIKLLIHGPRLTGKTELARKLAEYYGLKYLNPEDLLDHRKQVLQNKIKHYEDEIEMFNLMNAAEDENASFDNLMEQLGQLGPDDDDGHNEPSVDDEHEDATLETLTEQIMILTEELNQLNALNWTNNREEYEDVIMEMIKEQLNRRSTQYHGYVMDGWPDSAEACKVLFAKEEKEGEENVDDENDNKEEDEKEEEVDEALDMLNRNLLPDIVISLEAGQDWTVSRFISYMNNHPDLFPFISDRTQSHSDHYSTISSTAKPNHSIQDGIDELSVKSVVLYGENENEEDEKTKVIREFVEEYQQFQQNNAYPKGFTQFFNETFNFPIVFNVEEESLADILANIMARLGTPRVLLGEQYRNELDETRRREIWTFEQFEHGLQDLAARGKAAYEFKMEQWAGLNNILHYERSNIQDLFNLPLRHYLMKYVLPLVTRGMNDVSKVNPSCPVDYLAEYFFKENPEFKFSNVHYNAKAEHFFNTLCAMKQELKELQ